MNARDPLTDSLRDVLEVEQFLHDFIGALTKRRLMPGEDVTHLVDELGLKPPASFKGVPITWVGQEESEDAAETRQGQTLVLTRPGIADALGLTIGCVRIRGRKYCLECGFWYCRIVIRF
jgi:hypothetical protein